MEEWRIFLYPLGFIPVILFTARFLVQWLLSEKQGRSIVTPFFWQLSITANLLLALHAFIQLQYHVCVVQACNAVLSWRNLNLMQDEKKRVSFQKVIEILAGSIALTTLLFALQGTWEGQSMPWFRSPKNYWQFTTSPLSLFWHLIGFVSYILFSSRFWIQWWLAEKNQVSQLPLSFWWLSLSGAILSLAYFLQMGDLVNFIGPALGLVPYTRNLMLIYKTRQLSRTQHD